MVLIFAHGQKSRDEFVRITEIVACHRQKNEAYCIHMFSFSFDQIVCMLLFMYFMYRTNHGDVLFVLVPQSCQFNSTTKHTNVFIYDDQLDQNGHTLNFAKDHHYNTCAKRKIMLLLHTVVATPRLVSIPGSFCQKHRPHIFPQTVWPH